MVSEKDKLKTTIAFDSDTWKTIQDTMKTQNLDSIKDTVQLLITKAQNNMEKRIDSTVQMREPLTTQTEQEIPSCPYASLTVKTTKNGLEHYAYCDNPHKKNLPQDHLIPTSACQKCWERQQAQKIEFNQVFKQMIEEANYFKEYWCEEWEMSVGKKLKLPRQRPNYLNELPCIKNVEHECQRMKELAQEKSDLCDCPLFIHKEWRKLFAENIGIIEIL